MFIEKITKEKAISLRLPFLLSHISTAPEEAEYYLLSVDKILSVYFVVAIVLFNNVLFITDEDYRKDIEKHLEVSNWYTFYLLFFICVIFALFILPFLFGVSKKSPFTLYR